jgi:hypothetical protein
MSAEVEWVLLSYRLPREPSTPRISVWRKLKRLGVAQLGDGLVALPLDARTREQLEWIAAQVVEAHGSATVWLGRPAIARAGRDLAEQLTRERAEEYRQLVSEALRVLTTTEDRTAARRRLQAELDRISRRDYFPSAERALAAEAVASIVEIGMPNRGDKQ